jgi:hypothetical protein
LAGKIIFLSLPVIENQVKKDPEFLKVDLALKMSIRGMSIEGIADVLEVQPVTVKPR